MKELKGFKDAKVYTEMEKLPAGGYIIKVLNVETTNYGYGDVIVLSFDIAEGEHKDFYKANYAAQTQEDKKWKGTYRINVPTDDGSEQDAFRMRKFKTDISIFEDNNKTFHWDWDEQKLKGLTVGALFRDKEYSFEGRNGFFTECFMLSDTDKIRNGSFKIPAPKTLKRKEESANVEDMFLPVSNAELPFN